MQSSVLKTVPSRPGDQSDDLAAILRREIVTGEIEAGTPMRQEDLARRLQASRMPIREALRMLASEGLVSFRPNRGAVVAPIDPDELRDITDLRVALETMTIRDAIPRLTNQQIDMAAHIQDEIERADPGGFAPLNARFHLTLYEAADRTLLLRQVANLHSLSERYLTVAIRSLDFQPQSSDEHRTLLDVCYARDADRAAEILTAHILVPGRAVEDRLRQS